MKLIVDIPDEQYNLIKLSDKSVFADASSKECMLNSIKNGTPISIDGDLISREALRKEFEKVYPLSVNEMGGIVNKQIYDIIDNAPIVEPKRPQGTWIRREDPRYAYDRENGHIMAGVSFHCSECSGMGDSSDAFCKHCGTPMKLPGIRI